MVRSAAKGWVKSALKLTDKTVLVTGANTGIGYQTSLDLAGRDARIILACRDQRKAESARAQIEKETGSKKIVTKGLDLSSFESIRSFAKDLNNTELRLDMLINNAGIMKHPQAKTKDGFEMHFGVNHLGPFLLTNLLLDLVKKSEAGRIVSLSSIAHMLGVLRWNDLNWENRRYSPMGAYNASKLMNILFTKELSKRLAGTNVTANCVHPGVVRTELNRTDGEDTSFYGRLTDFVFHRDFITITAEHGAQTSIYCAIAPELEGITGKYFSNCRKTPIRPFSATSRSTKKLWDISEELTGLRS